MEGMHAGVHTTVAGGDAAVESEAKYGVRRKKEGEKLGPEAWESRIILASQTRKGTEGGLSAYVDACDPSLTVLVVNAWESC